MPEEISYTGGENIRGVEGRGVEGRGLEARGVEAGGAEVRKRVSWPAIFGGTMVALGLQLLFLLFGLLIAFIIFNPGGVRAWSVAWFLITSIISLYAGGWVAARLSGNSDRGAAQLHGLVTWGLTMLTTFFFVTSSAWNVLSTSANVLATTVAARGPGQAAAQVPPAATFGQTIARSGWALALVLFIGVLLAAISSWMGGAAGKPSAATTRV